jgi:hypothetical protein
LKEEHGDVWLRRFNSFERQETNRQIDYKKRHWPELPDGVWSKNPDYAYPHILPEGNLRKVFYPEMAQALLDYCDQFHIAIHSGALNLKSSQAACFNVMFPLRLDLDLAARILEPLLPDVVKVTAMEFEYTGDEGATEWLGEPAGGKRGQNRTSIDVAVWWETSVRKILTLVEWKYTERSFGTCGGYASTGNHAKDLCSRLNVMDPNIAEMCYLTQGRNKRHYWERMEEAGINRKALGGVAGCPFRGPFYQLMRQYLLAAYLRKTEAVDVVEVASVSFGANTYLFDAPPELRRMGANVVYAWNKVLMNVPKMRHMRHIMVEEIVEGIKNDHSKEAQLLAGYLKDRYGL